MFSARVTFECEYLSFANNFCFWFSAARADDVFVCVVRDFFVYFACGEFGVEDEVLFFFDYGFCGELFAEVFAYVRHWPV